MPALRVAAILFAALALSCGGHPAQSFAGLVRVSGQSPFAPGCVNTAQRGTNFRSAEVEPFLAVDPLDARHLVGVWQQDRWSNGGSNGLGSAVSFDGGSTWRQGFAAFTACSGGSSAKGTDFERATDPWVTFGADGTPHQIAFAFNGTSPRGAMLTARSLDGGLSWTDPIFLTQDDDPDVALDKESITADPRDARLVYAVWDRLTGVTTPEAATNRGPSWFSRTTDGGATWEPARIIFDPGPNSQTIGNQIAVAPNGNLVDLTTVISQLDQQQSPARVAVVISADQGRTWSAPFDISALQAQGITDPKSHVAVRSGDIVPEIAVDRTSGALYAVWEDSRFTQGARDGIVLASSVDGGMKWSAPVPVNRELRTQAFTPSIAVAADGRVGVTYYDLRNDDPGDSSQLLATVWLAVSSDGGRTWQESAAGGPFDIRSAARTDEGYFVGDYQGLIAAGTSFLPLFVLANNGNAGNRSDVFARPPTTAHAAGVSGALQLVAPRMQRSGLRRAY